MATKSKKSPVPDLPPEILIKGALEGTYNPKWAAKIMRDWLTIRLNEMAHQAHKSEYHWKNAPGTDDEKLGRILTTLREMIMLVDEAAKAEEPR